MTLPLAGKRIGLLTASASRLGGGVFEAVVTQAALIRASGGEAVVFALADAHGEEDRVRFAPSPVQLAAVSGPAQVGYAPELARMLDAAGLDLLHLHGIWMYPSRAGTLWTRRNARPYVISPHGMLDPWITARGRWKKALARVGYERASWAAASHFHALTPREAADITRESGRDDSIVIPNAGPDAVQMGTEPRGPDVFYIGRIHPKKNIAALIAGWGQLVEADAFPPHARLTIAGWGEAGDVAELRRLLNGAPASIEFIGPCFGEDKARRLAEARFVILPSLSEGLPMVALEAWAAGAPVLMTEECNLPEGFASGAALDCGYSPASIAASLQVALALPRAEWQTMAQAGLGLASGVFAAATVAARWAECYAGLIGGKQS